MQKQIDKYGLIGKDISYSFSKKFFTQKFINEGLNNCSYKNYDISSISDAITNASSKRLSSDSYFGEGNTSVKIKNIIKEFLLLKL